MKSFLVKNKKPIVKWGMIPEEIYFEGEIPQSFSLAISPHEPYVILDIDKHGKINGFDNIPHKIMLELKKSLNYITKNNGMHVWLKYTGDKELLNKPSGKGIDLRNYKGYVVWYKDNDIRQYKHLINKTSKNLNKWLEKLFTNNKQNEV